MLSTEGAGRAWGVGAAGTQAGVAVRGPQRPALGPALGLKDSKPRAVTRWVFWNGALGSLRRVDLEARGCAEQVDGGSGARSGGHAGEGGRAGGSAGGRAPGWRPMLLRAGLVQEEAVPGGGEGPAFRGPEQVPWGAGRRAVGAGGPASAGGTLPAGCLGCGPGGGGGRGSLCLSRHVPPRLLLEP